MDFRITSDNRARAGATLAETVIAMGVAGMVLLSLGALYLYSTRSFVTLKNHLDIDSASSRAMDNIGREIRQADRLVSFGTNRVTLTRGGVPFSFVFTPQDRVLYRESGGARDVLLRDCDFVQFDYFQRNPQPGGKGFFKAAYAGECKVVQVTWQASKTTGRTSANASFLRSAQIVIRNQKLL
jgi:hypothetical protein